MIGTMNGQRPGETTGVYRMRKKRNHRNWFLAAMIPVIGGLATAIGAWLQGHPVGGAGVVDGVTTIRLGQHDKELAELKTQIQRTDDSVVQIQIGMGVLLDRSGGRPRHWDRKARAAEGAPSSLSPGPLKPPAEPPE